MAQYKHIKYPTEMRLPIERLAAKLGKLRGGPDAKPVDLNVASIEAAEYYEKAVDRQLKSKGIELS